MERYILPNVLAQGFDEVLVVGMTGVSGVEPGVRYLDPEPIWKNTQDALMKRDLAALASESDVLVYLADDHRFYTPGFAHVLRASWSDHRWDALVPQRVTVREGATIALPNGFYDPRNPVVPGQGYIAGHCGIYRRAALRAAPWLTVRPRDPWWDVRHTAALRAAGGVVQEASGLEVEDIEHLLKPESAPWR